MFGKLATFRATVQNVANEAYWASDIGGYLTQGAPRTVVLSIATDFLSVGGARVDSPFWRGSPGDVARGGR